MEIYRSLIIVTVLASSIFGALAAPAFTQNEPVREKKFAPFFGSFGYSAAYSYGAHYPVTTYAAAPVAAVAAAPVASVAAVAPVATYTRAYYPAATYTRAIYPAAPVALYSRTLYHAPVTTYHTFHHYY